MELRQYARLIWRWLWLIIVCALLAGGAAYAVSANTAPVYQSSISLLINQARSGNSSADYSALLTGERLAKTYAELMRKRPVLEAVIANLALPGDAEALTKRVSVAPVRDTQLIVLTVEDGDPQRAADTANEIVRVFGQQNQALQAGRYTDTRQGLERELAKVQLDIDRTQAGLSALKSPGTSADETERDRLQTLLAQYRNSYATLFKSLGDIRLAEAQSTDSLSVAEAARPEATPVRPRTTVNTLLGLVVGALLGFGLAFLIEYLDDRVKSAGQAATLSGVMSLGAIGRFAQRDPADQLVVLREPQSPIAEAYRMLRINLDFTAIDGPLGAVVVTSGSPEEGKSTTIANLAVALAEVGRCVILVDADLRRPTLHRILGLPNERGVTTALLRPGPGSASEYLQATAVPNLWLLSSGPIPPNPAELLSSRRMAELVESLRSQADIVLFDTPPLLVFADALVMAGMCDGTLLVARANFTRAGTLAKVRAQCAQAGARLLGVALNQAPMPRGRQQSYYYYYSEERNRRRGWFGLGRRRKRAGQAVMPPAAAAPVVIEPPVVLGAAAPDLDAPRPQALELGGTANDHSTGSAASGAENVTVIAPGAGAF